MFQRLLTLFNDCRCGVNGCNDPHPDFAPSLPTDGWLYSELERLGVRARGTNISAKAMVTILVDRFGYKIDKSKYGGSLASMREVSRSGR